MPTIAKCRWTTGGVTKDAWKVRYTDAAGAPRSRQFAGKRAAQAFAREIEAEKAAAAGPKTLVDLCADYLATARRRHSEGRIGRGRLRALEAAFRDRVPSHFGDRLAAAVTEADVDAYHDALLRPGTLNQRSARVQLQYLLLVEAEANKRGHLLHRPVEAAMRSLRPIARTPIRTFTVDEVRRLVALAPQRPPGAHERATAQLACFVTVAAFCGLRVGEIAALSIAAVRFDERLIEVRHSVTAERTIKRPKTKAGVRDVPMPPPVEAMLRAWADRHYRPNPAGLLFTGRDGGPINLSAMHALWTGLLDRAGLAHASRPFHFHALRHFYASMMVEAGTPLADAAIMLGHRSFDMTLQTYTHSLVRGPARHGFVDRMVDRFAASAVGRDCGAASQVPALASPPATMQEAH